MERLLSYFEPEKYVLDLIIDKKAKNIGGRVKVFGEAKNEVVKFHAVKLDIQGVLINGDKAEFKADGETLEINHVPLGEVEISIYYQGKLNENMEGAYLSTYEYEGHTETIVATQFESHYARKAFPCIDEPAAKAVFELTLTLPEGSDDLVLANTPMKSSFKNTTIFEPTPKMSTYLLAWVIGRFHGKTVKNEHGVIITTYCALNHDIDSVDYANEIAARSLEFYDDNFGVPYPLPKLDQVALPDFEAGAMENWGLVTYRESMLLAGESATLSAKKGVALTVAHELSHQWFGDLVTMKWWDDLWLNESFASVMEYFAVDHIHPEYKIFEGFFTRDAYLALMRDAYEDVQSVHQDVVDPAEIATLFDGAIVYSKGARLMLMVVRLMGWDKFCDGLKEYFEKYQYQNTAGDDLWACLSKHAGFDVRAMMHAFIDRPGYPVVTSTEENFTKFSQQRFLLDGTMPDSDWPLFEIREDMTGHYILNLSDVEFEARLARFDELSLEEKLRLLIDRNLLAKTDLVSTASLVPLLNKFKNENSAAVWNIIVSIVANLKIFVEPDSEEEKDLKNFVRQLIEPKLSEVGLKTREGDDENTIRLRAILMGLDYFAETEENLKTLAEMYDSDFSKLDAETREDIIDAKLYMEPTIIDEYIDKYQTLADPEIKFELLFAGTLSKNEAVLDKMLSLLGQTEIVKPQDQDGLFVYLYRNAKCRDKAFNWLTTHWEEVKNMAGEKSLDDYPRLTGNIVRTESEYAAWRDFFEPMGDNPAMARSIKIGKKEIEARLKLIQSDQEAVKTAIKNGAH